MLTSMQLLIRQDCSPLMGRVLLVGLTGSVKAAPIYTHIVRLCGQETTGATVGNCIDASQELSSIDRSPRVKPMNIS